MTTAKLSSAQVASALRKGPFRDPAHAWLEQVRSGTGYGSRERYADALAVSLWPSRGIWFAGIEIKVDRGDWLREVDAPEKAAEIMKWCDFWYVAAPAGIVELGEVPETWGLYVVEKGKAKLVKEAPRLSPELPTRTFVASVLRNAAQALTAVRQAGHNEGYEAAAAAYGEEATDLLRKEAAETKRELEATTQRLGYRDAEVKRLQAEIAEFTARTGITWVHGYQKSNAELVRIAAMLQQLRPATFAKYLDDLAAALRAVDVEVPEPKVVVAEALRPVVEIGEGPR